MKPVANIGISLIVLILFGGCSHIGSIHGYTIASKSMEPTIYEGDKITTDESYYSNHSIADGDLVVFRHNGFMLVKRVSAVAGETIEGKDGILIRNGYALSESYAHHSGDPSSDMQTFSSRTIPKGEVFVTGDDRDSSLDSRLSEFGVVRTSDVLGIATYVMSSKHSIGGHPLK